jgi:hypothetical protein
MPTLLAPAEHTPKNNPKSLASTYCRELQVQDALDWCDSLWLC